MKRRIYKLTTKFTLLGLEGADWGVLFGTFVLTINFFRNTIGQRAALLVSIVATALVFFVWHFVKDKVPEKFVNHFLNWLGEPEVYRVVPDTKNVPLVVDFKEVRVMEKQKGNRKDATWRIPVGRPDSWL